MTSSATPPPLRVVVADDQASVRDGLVLLLGTVPDLDVVASAADGAEALERVAEHRPDAVLLDLHMPVLDGIGATRRLTAEHPGVAVVVLTTYVDDASIMDALRAGARSFLTKSADRADIARALRAAVRGLGMLDPRAREVLLAAADQGAQDSQGGQGARGAPADPQAQGAPDTPAARTTPAAPGGTPAARNAPGSARPGTAPQPPPDGLTEREAEILALIARGLTNAEIAARLFLSGNTVKTHINRVFAKTGSRDRAAAIVYAHRHHLA